MGATRYRVGSCNRSCRLGLAGRMKGETTRRFDQASAYWDRREGQDELRRLAAKRDEAGLQMFAWWQRLDHIASLATGDQEG